MKERFSRLLETLKLIPHHPKKISQPEIKIRLAGLGYNETERTIQRNLHELSHYFPIVCDTRGKPYGWNFTEGSKFSLTNISPYEALTKVMALTFIQHLLPPAVNDYLKPQLSDAYDQLERHNTRNFVRWPNKIAHVPRGFQLAPATINNDILVSVYNALLDEKQLLINYKNKTDKTINPLSLVSREQVIYLVCTFLGYTDIRHIALHRIQAAKISTLKSIYPDGYKLKEYIDNGYFSYKKSDNTLMIELLFNSTAASHLSETPLSNDQCITVKSDNKTLVTGTVLDTSDLRWWILGFGDQIEVLAPAPLRKEMAAIAANLTKRYSVNHANK